MRKLYNISESFVNSDKYDFLSDLAKDKKVQNLREKLLGGMYSDSAINLVKNLIPQDSESVHSREEFINYLKSPEFDQEFEIIQDLVWLNPDEIYPTITEFLICLGFEADQDFLKKDPKTVEFLRIYSEFISHLGYKELNKYIVDSYPQYFKKIA